MCQKRYGIIIKKLSTQIIYFCPMNYRLLILFTLINFTLLNSIKSQKSNNIALNFTYGMDLPGADMADRFGLDYNAALDLDYNLTNGYFLGIHGHYILGPLVKEDVISNIRSSDGNLISQQQLQSIITLKQRAFLYGIHAGKFINLSKKDAKHGFRLRVGSSIMSHYIIFNDESAATNQLLGDYGKGYDRLTRGITIEEFIGYQYISADERMNFYAGFSLVQGFTQNKRPVDFDTRMRNDEQRLDMLNGFRAGFVIKLFEFGNAEDTYY